MKSNIVEDKTIKRSLMKRILVGFSILFFFMVLFLLALEMNIVEVMISPSPLPHKASSLFPNHSISGCGEMRADTYSYQYRVEKSIVEVEQYYREEMTGFCSSAPEFNHGTGRTITETDMGCQKDECRVSKCYEKGGKFLAVGSFYVMLKPLSDSQTEVYQSFTILKNVPGASYGCVE